MREYFRIFLLQVFNRLKLLWQEIYAGGGRKFGFINLPTVGCFPGLRIIKAENNGSCLEEVSSLAKLHNQALSKVLKKLGNQLKGFKYSLYDLNYNLRQRTKHPSKYCTYSMQNTYQLIIKLLGHINNCQFYYG